MQSLYYNIIPNVRTFCDRTYFIQSFIIRTLNKRLDIGLKTYDKKACIKDRCLENRKYYFHLVQSLTIHSLIDVNTAFSRDYPC